MLPPLNFPLPSFQYRNINGKTAIFDVLRKKYLVLTPEEWVRQHVIHYLIFQLAYPKSLIKLESGLKVNNIAFRSDIVVYNRAMEVFMLIECKAPSIALSTKTFEQAGRYNLSLQAKYLAITNGLNNYCCEINRQENKITFLPEFPVYPTID